MNFEDDISAYEYGPGTLPRPLARPLGYFLSWVWIWMMSARDVMCFTGLIGGRDAASEPRDAPEGRSTLNWFDRTTRHKTFSPSRYIHQHRPLFGRGLSHRQFFERMAIAGISGRVLLYGFKYWGKRAARAARIFGNRARQWRVPFGRLGRLSGGVWGVHLWPG